ncbi:MAG: hypothetical protein HY549_07280 [Elusimicrobia bacterium]|nr:hypothetical protein [Elusimicrobiota bacterium]
MSRLKEPARSVCALFERLVSVPTAPFFERSALQRALSWARSSLPRSVAVHVHRGGAVLRYQGSGTRPALCLAGHIDHPTFHLKGNRARMMGGLPAHLLPGSAIQAFPARPSSNEPLGIGRLGRGRDGTFQVHWTRPPSRRAAFAVLDLPPFVLDGRWVLSRSIDDLMGSAISLEVLRRAASAGLKTNLTVLLHRAEEVGFVGALDLIARKHVSLLDSVLSIETSRELPGARPGKGPVIRLGDKASAFDPNLTALLDLAASKLKPRKIRVQRLRLTGGTCEATAYLAFGYEASGVAIPLVNYHNGWGAKSIAPEKVRVEDIAGAVELLLEAAKLFPFENLRGRLRARLAARQREHSRHLAFELA